MLDIENAQTIDVCANDNRPNGSGEKVGDTNFLETRSTPHIRDQAVEAGKRYIHSAVTTRADRYRFLALAYSAYRDGQKDPQEFDNWLTARLNREPTEPERKRPFLRVVHALLNGEALAPLQYLPAYTMLTTALEHIDEEFKATSTVTEDGVIEFIKDSGGVNGIYRRRLEDHSPESETDDAPQPTTPVEKAPKASARRATKPAKAPQSQKAAGTNPSASQDAAKSQDQQDAPITIEIAKLGAWVIKDGEDATLKMPAFAPGEHPVRLKIGQDGVVEEIISEEQSYREAALGPCFTHTATAVIGERSSYPFGQGSHPPV